MSSSIVLKNLSVDYQTADGPVLALAGVNLEIEKGSFVSIIGPSGCGKSTLLRLIANLETQRSGEISIFGQTPSQAADQRQCGFIFQKPALFPWLNIEKNIQLPMKLSHIAAQDRANRASELLRLVDLQDFAKKYPWQLSGGMQQRASIARALALDCPILLMDEPFAALDEMLRDYMNVQLRKLWQESSRTVVFVTHSISEAVYLSDKVVVMSERPGKVHEEITVQLPEIRPLEIRDTPEFSAISSRVRRALRYRQEEYV